MAQQPSILLFDIDGTLVRAGGAGRKALERAFQQLHGVDGVFDGYAFAGRTDLIIVRHGLLRVLGRPATSDELEAVVQLYLSLLPRELELTDRFEVIDGVVDTLDTLAANGHFHLGLATGNLEQGAKLKLGRGGLWHHFSFGAFGSDAEDRAALTHIAVDRGLRLARQPVPPSRTYVIGDTPADVAAAKAVGVVSVAVTTGFAPRQALVSAHPDLMVDNLLELLPIVLPESPVSTY